MSNKIIAYTLGVVTLVTASAFLYKYFPDKEKVTNKKPNVLFIIVDDLRPELGCYGNDFVKSPNIDAFAKEAVIFDKAYCQSPVCGASRASFLTGIYPTKNRFTTYDSRADKDADNIPTLPEWFKNNGYYTISNGKVFHDMKDSKESWSEDPYRPETATWHDYLIPQNEQVALSPGTKGGPSHEITEGTTYDYYDGKVLKKTINDLQKLKDQDEPFFVAAGFVKPHLPFNAPKKFWDIYMRENVELADNPWPAEDAPEAASHNFGELRAYTDIPKEGPVPDSTAITLRHGYYACISYVDFLIGELIAEMKKMKLYDNTIIVLMSDHGYLLGNHALWCKHANYNLAMRSTLIVKDLKGNKGRNTSVVELLDLYPTLCEMTEIKEPEHTQGFSFASLLLDNADHKEGGFSRFKNGESIISPPYIFTQWVNQRGEVYAEMLFDHEADPNENKNIVDDPSYQNVYDKLSKKLNLFIQQNE